MKINGIINTEFVTKMVDYEMFIIICFNTIDIIKNVLYFYVNNQQ